MRIDILCVLICGLILIYESAVIVFFVPSRLKEVLIGECMFKPIFYIITHLKKTCNSSGNNFYSLNSGNDDKKTNNFVVHKVEKTSNFTIMSNFHLRSKNLSLKAKGLMSEVLSFPENWHFSVSGLVSICKEGESAVKSALEELKKYGYLKVTKFNPSKSNSCHYNYKYEFFECSVNDTINENNVDNSSEEMCSPGNQIIKTQGEENLSFVKETVEEQTTEKKPQLKKENQIENNKELNHEKSIYQSNGGGKTPVDKTGAESIEGYTLERIKYTDLVKKNIDFINFVDWLDNNVDEAEEYVQMIVRQICSQKPKEHICNEEVPREIVKSALLKVDIGIMQEAIEKVSHKLGIDHYDKYFISVLFNMINVKNAKSDYDEESADYAFKSGFVE